MIERCFDLRRLPAASTGYEKRLEEMQVEQTDRGIDALVHALYGLTRDEIAVVEAGAAR